MELIIALLFFSLSAAVCIKVFFAADRLSTQSRELTEAVLQVQNAAECVKSRNPENALSHLFLVTKKDDYHYIVYFDNTFQNIGKAEQASYEMKLSLACENDILTSTINYYKVKEGKSIFSLSVKHFTQREGL